MSLRGAARNTASGSPGYTQPTILYTTGDQAWDNGHALAGATITEPIAIFLDDGIEDIVKVAFWLDSEETATEREPRARVNEKNSPPAGDEAWITADFTQPFDIFNQSGDPLLWDPAAGHPRTGSSLANGAHTVTIGAVYRDGGYEEFTADFTLSLSGAPVGDPPAVPAGLNVVSSSPGSFFASWTPVSGVSHYDYSFATVNPPNGAPVSIFSPSVSRFGLAGGRWWVRVRSVGTDGQTSAWSAAVSVQVASLTGSAGRATGDTYNAMAKRTTTQGSVVYNNTFHVPRTAVFANGKRTEPPWSGTNISIWSNGVTTAMKAVANGFGINTTGVDVPMLIVLWHGLSWSDGGGGQNYSQNQHVITYTHMAEIAQMQRNRSGQAYDGLVQAITKLFNRTDGGVPKGWWLQHVAVRIGWEIGGNWNPVFPGIDPRMKLDLPVNTSFDSEVNAAWAHTRQTGERFPMYRLAWDATCNNIDRICEELCDAAGVQRRYPLIIANLASGSADPEVLQTSKPVTQWTPYAASDVTRLPDVIGWDTYGRDGPGPQTLPGKTQDGKASSYNWGPYNAERDEIANLCRQLNRPLGGMEVGACRKRDKDKVGGYPWRDDQVSAWWDWMLQWADSGCGDHTVPIWVWSLFLQNDTGAVGLDIRVRRNISYTFHSDTLGDLNLAPAPLTRATMLKWYNTTDVN